MNKLLSFFKKIDESKYCFFLVNVIAFIIMFALTHQSKLYSDDFNLFRVTEDYGGGIVYKAYRFAKDYYMLWGGRCIAAFLRVFFALQNKVLFDVVNTIIYVLLCNLIYAFAYPIEKRQEKHTGLLLFIYCILWFSLPTFGEVTIWLTGSIAYMWIGIFCVLLIYLLHKRFAENSVTDGSTTGILAIQELVKTVLGVFIGFIAGCASEPSACMLTVSVLAWTLYMKKNKKKIFIWEWAGVLGAVLGFIFLFTAPGIYERSDAVTLTGSLIARFMHRFLRQTYYSVKYLLVPLAFAILPTLKDIKSVTSFKEYLYREKEQLVLLMMAFINVYVMVLSPGSSNRIYFVPVVLIVAAAGISYRKYIAGVASVPVGTFVAMFALLTVTSIFTAYVTCARTGEPLEMQMDYNAGDKAGNLF